MPNWRLSPTGIANSVIMPPVVILPILLPTFSANHRLLSDPVVISTGVPKFPGISNSVIVPIVQLPEEELEEELDEELLDEELAVGGSGDDSGRLPEEELEEEDDELEDELLLDEELEEEGLCLTQTV